MLDEAVQVHRCPNCGAEREIVVPAFLARGHRVQLQLCPGCVTLARQAEEERAAEEERQRRDARREQRSAAILDVLAEAGVNVWDHQHATLASYDAGESGDVPLAAARRFLQDVRDAAGYDQVRGLYLVGPTGAGKSHLAVAVARELLMDPDISTAEVVYDHALRLIGRIQRTYGSDERAEEVLQRRIDARLWILDDLGTEAPSADVVRRLTEIITERAMRPTIVTSNLHPGELEARNPEFFRVVSRFGPRYFRVVRVAGRDRRFEVA